ncbi:MAG: hypothetical protein J7647_22285 [Cyanobacteria bacterium SBLK]|nr:hypothetical protein [Cyanobacteria bacterium SBLK]
MQDPITITAGNQTVIIIPHQQPTPTTNNKADPERQDWRMWIILIIVFSLGLAAISGK